MLRRDFCQLSLALLAAGMTGCIQQSKPDPTFNALLSGCDDQDGNHYIACMDSAGRFIARIEVPQRVHGSVYVPQMKQALYFARRPGNHLYVMDIESGALLNTVENTQDRHFYGHGVISGDGKWLYTTENNLHDLSGVIGIYDLSNLSVSGQVSKVAEYASGGIGPHQLALMPDQKTLVVANGGMATHPASGRKVLNLETMAPNLAYLDLSSGRVIESHRPPNHKMSIRHLDVAADGMVVFGVQYQGELTDAVPLIASHRRGQALRWLELPESLQLRIKQYTASVAVDEQASHAMVSCPRGDLIACWDLASGTVTRELQSRDAAGLFRAGPGLWVSSTGCGNVDLLDTRLQNGTPLLTTSVSHSTYRWDNHLTVI